MGTASACNQPLAQVIDAPKPALTDPAKEKWGAQRHCAT
jgi:hypothetical protein